MEEKVVPCDGNWLAIFLGSKLGSEEIFFYVRRVCAWKYTQDDDAEYTPIEPIIWDGKHSASCQNEVGFRGCIVQGDQCALARCISDPDIDQIPGGQFDAVCRETSTNREQVDRIRFELRQARIEKEQVEEGTTPRVRVPSQGTEQ